VQATHSRFNIPKFIAKINDNKTKATPIKGEGNEPPKLTWVK